MVLSMLGEVCPSCSVWIVDLLFLWALGPELALGDVVLREKHMVVPKKW